MVYILKMKSYLKLVGALVIVSILIPIIFYVCLQLWGDWNDEWTGYNNSLSVSDGYCNIAVVPIMGEIHSYGALYDDYGNEVVSTNMSDSLELIRRAEEDLNILGILALVDSPGGTAAAAEMIGDELKSSSVPVAAYIAESGTSAAYLVASAADTVIASPFSDVGSIGITMSYLNYTEQNKEQGVEFISLTSAKYKDYTNPDKPLTYDERILLERDLAIWHDEFVNQVAMNRTLNKDDVLKLADGSSVPGKLALETGLIDALGTKETARDWFAEQLNVSSKEIVFCQ